MTPNSSGDWLSWLERCPYKADVTGSSPVSPIGVSVREIKDETLFLSLLFCVVELKKRGYIPFLGF